MDLEIARWSVQLFYTIVHFPTKIVIQSEVLETWSIVTVDMKSLEELIRISPVRCCQPQNDCHFLPIRRSTDRDITTGRN